MRFGSGPGSFFWPVRWYYTTRDFRRPSTVYWSHNWTETQSRPWWDTGELGEIYGAPREWVNGAPPPPGDTGVAHGDDLAWLGSLDGPSYNDCSTYPVPDTGAYSRAYSWGWDAPA